MLDSTALTTIDALLKIGTSGLLLAFLFVIWKDRRDTIASKDKLIESKDAQIAKMGDQMTVIVEKNTEAITGLKGAMEANTKSTDTLTDKMFDVLTGKGK